MIHRSVPCAVWEGEQGNTLSNFEIEDTKKQLMSDYFIDSYRCKLLTDDVLLAVGGWSKIPEPTELLTRSTSSKYL